MHKCAQSCPPPQKKEYTQCNMFIISIIMDFISRYYLMSNRENELQILQFDFHPDYNY